MKPCLLLLMAALLVCMTGCTAKPSANSNPSPTEFEPAVQLTTETTDPEPQPSTDPLDEPLRRAPEEITVYPFTEEELLSASAAVEEFCQVRAAQNPHLLEFDIKRIDYDPIMTDFHIQTEMTEDGNELWDEELLYACRVSFAVSYHAVYGLDVSQASDSKRRAAMSHLNSILQVSENGVLGVYAGRRSPETIWLARSIQPAEPYSACIMPPEETEQLRIEGSPILAGYAPSDGQYLFYAQDADTGLITCSSFTEDQLPGLQNHSSSLAVWDESTWQIGEPVTPDPGDTQYTYRPELMEDYPADDDCEPMQLLEKWMAVEGLTMDDLDSRDCSQLVLVVARATDGVDTYTLCFDKQADGSWAPVDDLLWMNGWTGSRGIMHNREINSYTSPAGLWPLGLAFGIEPMPEGLKLPWRDVTPNSDWITQPDSKYFNTWQERDDAGLDESWLTDKDNVEHLINFTGAYDYACVIRYNVYPYTIPSRGCAIFLHCSTGPTAGCIGLPRSDMVNTLLWLDPDRNPYILITGHE